MAVFMTAARILCSWIVALRLAAGVYRDAAIASQIWTAITEQSRVFRVISESTNPAYERALRCWRPPPRAGNRGAFCRGQLYDAAIVLIHRIAGKRLPGAV